ncbi:MAG: 30S ribosomal protein S19, partial [Pyrobaculum sp.]
MSSKEQEAQKGKQGWITPAVIPPEEWATFRYRGKTLEELLNMPMDE